MSLIRLVESSSSRLVRLLPFHLQTTMTPHSHNRSDDSLVVSLSNGEIVLIKPGETGYALAARWYAHEHEPWVVAWNYWDKNIVYSGTTTSHSFTSTHTPLLFNTMLGHDPDSAYIKPTGGDDLTLKSWDVRTLSSHLSTDSDSPAAPISRNCRSFSGGVTSIQASPHQPGKLAVSSYDSTVRIFDTRNLMQPVCEADVDGGVWRVKFHPSNRGRAREVLVGAMHAGCRVVSFERGVMGGDGDGDENGTEGDGWRIVRTFEKHESMVYGVDWSYKGIHSGSGAEETVVGSCSFYDHVLHLWRG